MKAVGLDFFYGNQSLLASLCWPVAVGERTKVGTKVPVGKYKNTHEQKILIQHQVSIYLLSTIVSKSINSSVIVSTCIK